MSGKAEKQRCPRRAEAPYRMANEGEEEDAWLAGHGVSGQARGCSYCGSMQPDDFMQAIRDGYTVGPTDKDYKVYLHETPTAEQIQTRGDKLLAEMIRRGMSNEAAHRHVDHQANLWSQGPTIGKFYFQHLSPEQRTEFIQLYNAKSMKVGYPGHFYRVPFFCDPMTPLTAQP